jgi:hypothetical protein
MNDFIMLQRLPRIMPKERCNWMTSIWTLTAPNFCQPQQIVKRIMGVTRKKQRVKPFQGRKIDNLLQYLILLVVVMRSQKKM